MRQMAEILHQEGLPALEEHKGGEVIDPGPNQGVPRFRAWLVHAAQDPRRDSIQTAHGDPAESTRPCSCSRSRKLQGDGWLAWEWGEQDSSTSSLP